MLYNKSKDGDLRLHTMRVNKVPVSIVRIVWLIAAVAPLLLVTDGWSQEKPAGLGAPDVKPLGGIGTLNSPRLDKEYLTLSNHVAAIQTEKAEIEAEAKAIIDQVKAEIERMVEIRSQLEEEISNEEKRVLLIEHEQLFQKFQEKNLEAGKLRKAKMTDLAARDSQKRDMLLKKVRQAIGQVTKERNIIFVIEYGQLDSRGEVIWYADDELDITDEVLQFLNSETDGEEVDAGGK